MKTINFKTNLTKAKRKLDDPCLKILITDEDLTKELETSETV